MILTKSAENSTIEKSTDIIRYVVSDCYMPAFNQQVSKQGRVTTLTNAATLDKQSPFLSP